MNMSENSNYKWITAWEVKDGFAYVYRDGTRKVRNVKFDRWYFYISVADYARPEIKRIINHYFEEGVLTDITVGKKYVKIYSPRPTKEDVTIDMLREDLDKLSCISYEFDIPRWKRFMIDNNIQVENEYKILYFDIETDDSNNGIEIGRDRIISWAAKDSDGKEYYEQGDEKAILQKFINVIKKYDIITGWNSENFDLPYIQMRCEKHEIFYNWRSIIHIDMLQRCFKIYSYEAPIIGLRSFSLNEISKTFLGEEKTELEGMKVWELERDRPDLLKEYNKRDVELLYMLDTKLSILPLMIQECVWTGSFLNKFYIGELLDNYILREARKKNIIMASKPSHFIRDSLIDVKIAGGYVMEPTKGYYKDVHICDFKSLYPSIIVGWNIGKDALNIDLSLKGHSGLKDFLQGRTIEEVSFMDWNNFLIEQKKWLDPNNEYIQTANNAFFSRTHNSFIGDLVENLLNERKEYKKKLKELEFDTKEYNNTYAAERVVKEMANSMFGITCDKNSRYFDKYVSEGITYTGQFLNKLSSYTAISLGLNSIYGDTDSIFLTGANDMNSSILGINDSMKNYLDSTFTLRKNIVSLEYEKLFGHLLILEKKRYTGLLSMKDGKAINKIFSRGTEDVKKSYIIYGKEKFKELTNMVFAGLDEESAIKHILDIKTRVLNGQISLKELLITTKVTKDPSKYKNKLVHTRLAERLIAEKKLTPIVESEKKMGTRLEYIAIDVDGKNEGVLLEEYCGNINLQYYWEKQIYAPMKRILDVVFPSHDWSKYNNDKIKKPRKSKINKPEQLTLI
jgi:DNA polymerase I